MDPRFLPMLAQGGQNFGSNLSQFLGGAFGDSGAPYRDAMKQWQKYYGQAQQYQNPFFEAGTNALPKYQGWLDQMSNPSEFINRLMGQYQQSPWARFQTEQGIRANNNAGSASGLIGSTPLGRENANYAEKISSEDMNQWLQNVLGINTAYGAGEGSLVSGGQNAANSISNLLQQLGMNMGEGAYGQRAGEQQDRSNMWSGLLHLFMG